VKLLVFQIAAQYQQVSHIVVAWVSVQVVHKFARGGQSGCSLKRHKSAFEYVTPLVGERVPRQIEELPSVVVLHDYRLLVRGILLVNYDKYTPSSGEIQGV